MHLIVETTFNKDLEYLTEEENGSKTLYIKGPFLQAEVINRNNRKYAFPILEREVNRYIKDKVNNKCAWGELNHPTNPSINLERAAILVQELSRDGYNYIGKAKVTSSPIGNIVRSLINDGGNLGVSCRGVGTLKQNKSGFMEVGEDYRLCVAADVVSDPSGPNCFVNGILENVNFQWDEENGWMQEVIDETRKDLKKLKVEDIEKMALPLFERYMATLKNNK